MRGFGEDDCCLSSKTSSNERSIFNAADYSPCEESLCRFAWVSRSLTVNNLFVSAQMPRRGMIFSAWTVIIGGGIPPAAIEDC